MNEDHSKRPSLLVSLFPVLFLIVFLYFSVIKNKQQPHVPLIFSAALASILARLYGIKWLEIKESIVKNITSTLGAVLILMTVGILIASWIQGGIVPALIYYGFDIVNPRFFLFTSALISALVSLATGSSWSTAGTIGLALMGLGTAMGINPAMTAGAIVSGAYFGDKMSPLSDTTNLAPAIAGTDLITHIRHMFYTTVPSLIIALIGYLIIGFMLPSGGAFNADAFTVPLKTQFTMSPILLLPPLVVIGLVAWKKPALPSLMAGVALGILAALLIQKAGFFKTLSVIKNGYVSQTGVKAVDSLLSRGGLNSMMDTVSLILCAVSFGGIMEAGGFLARITSAILSLVRGAGSLILATILTAIGVNVLAGDQYIAIVLPGRMYKASYTKLGLDPRNLSRALEDSATLTSPLVPWNTCGAFMWSTLGVFPLYYLPFAFLNILNPIISIFYGFTGITITKITETENSSSEESA